MNLALGGEEPVDIRRRHAEIASNVGNGRLAVTIVAKQLFSGNENSRDVFLTRRIGADIGKIEHEHNLMIYE